MKLTEPELEELKSLRAALTKIKKGDAKVLAIRDLLDGNLSNILSVAHLMKVRSENDSRDLDTYLWGMFHKNLVKDALDSLYLLSEEGYNQEETAQKLDIDIGSVKSQLSKARFKLRKFLD